MVADRLQVIELTPLKSVQSVVSQSAVSTALKKARESFKLSDVALRKAKLQLEFLTAQLKKQVFSERCPNFGRPISYLHNILTVAGEVAQEQCLVDAGPHAVPGPTDALAFLVRGLSGTTIAGFGDGGRFPNYHQALFVYVILRKALAEI